MRKTLVLFATLLFLGFPVHGQKFRPEQSFPIVAADWVINPGLSSQASPFDLYPSAGIAFNFPRSPNPDPNATPPWYGYFLQQVSGPITGSNIQMQLRIVESKTPVYNYVSAPDNTCVVPATVRFYFQTGALYNGDNNGTTRWWSNPVSYTLQAGPAYLTVPLDPSMWSDTFGAFGNQDAGTLAGFNNALANPTYVGMTFGGGCFFGHGVNTTFGKSQFRLLDYSTF